MGEERGSACFCDCGTVGSREEGGGGGVEVMFLLLLGRGVRGTELGVLHGLGFRVVSKLGLKEVVMVCVFL